MTAISDDGGVPRKAVAGVTMPLQTFPIVQFQSPFLSNTTLAFASKAPDLTPDSRPLRFPHQTRVCRTFLGGRFHLLPQFRRARHHFRIEIEAPSDPDEITLGGFEPLDRVALGRHG